MKRANAIGNLLGRTNEWKATVARSHPVPDQRQQIVRERLCMGKLQANEIVDRRPIGLGPAEMLEVIASFLVGRPTHHMREGQNLYRLSGSGGLLLQSGYFLRGPRRVDGGREQEVGVAHRELAPLFRAGSIDDG